MLLKWLGQFFIIDFNESASGHFEFTNTDGNTSVKRPTFKLSATVLKDRKGGVEKMGLEEAT